MGRFEEVKAVGERMMMSITDIVDEAVKDSFGSLRNLAGMDPKTLEMIRKGQELMDLATRYVTVSTEAFSELESLEEKNQNLLLEIRGHLALLSDKK